MAQWVMSPTSIREDVGSIPGLGGLKIQHCCELWCRLETWLGTGVADCTFCFFPCYIPILFDSIKGN